jgi:hypothetical protein
MMSFSTRNNTVAVLSELEIKSRMQSGAKKIDPKVTKMIDLLG